MPSAYSITRGIFSGDDPEPEPPLGGAIARAVDRTEPRDVATLAERLAAELALEAEGVLARVGLRGELADATVVRAPFDYHGHPRGLRERVEQLGAEWPLLRGVSSLLRTEHAGAERDLREQGSRDVRAGRHGVVPRRRPATRGRIRAGLAG